jgi:hypothetical protein
MPIEVELPDGNIVEFPDGTDNATMERALSQYAAKPMRPDFSNVQARVTTGRGAAVRQKPKIPRTQAELDAATGTNLDPSAGMGRFQQARAGFGKAFADTGQGLKQTVNAAQQVKAGLEGSLLLRAGLIDRPQFQEYISRVGVPLYERGQAMQQEVQEQRLTDQPLMSTGGGLAGNVAGYASQVIGPGLALRGTTAGTALLPRTIGGNALQGAGLGYVQPVASEDERGLNVGVGGVAGGAGAALPAAAVGLARTMRYGRTSGVEKRAARTLQEAMQGRQLNVEQSAIPGVNRTLGEASMDPGIMAIERNLRRQIETMPQFVDIDAANNAARVAALQGIAGDEASMAAAIQARDAAAEQARQRAFSGAQAFDSGRQAQAQAARAAEAEAARYRMFGLDPPASAVSEAPASAKAGLVSNMAALAEGSAGRPSVQNVIRSVQGAVADAPDDVAGLYNARKYVTDLLEGKAGSDMQSARAATRELMQAKELIDSEISARVGRDLWQNYLGAYQQGSRPINRMQIGQELLSRGRGAQDDILGNPLLQPAKFGRAARNLDDIAKSATGFNKAKPGDYLTGDDLKVISSINDDLRRVAVRQANPAQPGSATFEAGSLAGRIAQRGALQMAGRVLPLGVGESVKAYQEGMDKMLQEKLAFLVQNPKEAQRVLKALPPAQRSQLTQALMRLGSVSTSGAAFSE